MRTFLENEMRKGLEKYLETNPELSNSVEAIIRDTSLIVLKELRTGDTKKDRKHLRAQIANIEAIHAIKAGKEFSEVLRRIAVRLSKALVRIAVSTVTKG